MKQNMGLIDRIIRILVVAVIAILFYTEIISGKLAIGLLVVGGILVLTSLVSFCPLYKVFGINSGKK